MKRQRRIIEIFKATSLAIIVAGASILAGCGGGSNTLPYVPANAAKECVNGPRASERTAASASFDSVWCVQLHKYSEQIPILKDTTVSIPSGGSQSFEAIIYDAACSDISSGLSTNLSWSADSSLGSFSYSGNYASLTAATASSSTITGTISVMLFNGSTMVKQDSITVSILPPTTPNAPGTLAATAGDSQVSLSWAAPTTNTDSSSLADLAGYNVFYSTTSGGSYSQYNSSTIAGTSTTVSGLTNGTTYYFVVTAVDNESPVQESAYSTQVSATPDLVPATIPNAPGSLAATAGDSQVSLSWAAPTTNTDSSSLADLAGYNVFYSTTSGGSYSQYNSSTIAGTSTTVSGLTNGTTYYFVVTAVDNESPVQESAYSTETSAAPAAAVVLSVSAAASPTSATLSGGTATSTLTCTVSGGTATTLEGRCDSASSWQTIASGNTLNCTYTTAGTYTPGCRVDSTTIGNASTPVTISAAAASTFRQFFGDAGAGYEAGSSVRETSDGGYIMTGNGVGGAYVVKADSSGTELWTYTHTAGSFGWDVIETTDGGYLVSGDVAGTAFLLKLTTAGVLSWDQTYATTSHAYSVMETGSGYVITGDTGSDGKIVFVNTTGVEQSSQTYDNASNSTEFIRGIDSTTDGGYILAGYTGDGSADDVWLIKTDSSGVMTWQFTYNNNAIDHGVAVVETASGYAVGGYTADMTYSNADFLLLLTDSSGTQTALLTYGDAVVNDFCYGMSEASDGGLLLTGPSESSGSAGGEDFRFIKTNSSGTQLISQFYGTAGNEYSQSVIETGDGGFAILGAADNGGSADFWLIKTDSAGLSP